MHIYLPSTLPALATLLKEGRVEGAPLTAYAATAALRQAHGDDEEEVEYAAMMAAADASLELLAADPAAPRRRVVIAARLGEGAVREPEEPGAQPARVVLAGPVPLKRVVSAHVDDPAAADDVAAALTEPDAGHTEDHELMWYATQELPYLVE
ncbi:DUF6912 family protein [Salinactinospora qingdaonensis]|uniref:Uncharacterized protein n=1 Tax=Salinactinospora qingdaonensis TaxID=702744 RepID=A0ABP7FJH9_9ACTN